MSNRIERIEVFEDTISWINSDEELSASVHLQRLQVQHKNHRPYAVAVNSQKCSEKPVRSFRQDAVPSIPHKQAESQQGDEKKNPFLLFLKV